MALIERLMGLEEPKIPVHDFYAANDGRIRGALTAAQIKTALGMDAAAGAEYDALAAQAPSGGTTANQLARLDYLNKVHCVLILAESGYAGYDTPAAVRTKLGL
jgi:hypothetical protein